MDGYHAAQAGTLDPGAMRLFVCTDHDGHYPVGVASFILAHSEEQARRLLDEALAADGLATSATAPFTLREIDAARPQAVILNDGDY